MIHTFESPCTVQTNAMSRRDRFKRYLCSKAIQCYCSRDSCDPSAPPLPSPSPAPLSPSPSPSICSLPKQKEMEENRVGKFSRSSAVQRAIFQPQFSSESVKMRLENFQLNQVSTSSRLSHPWCVFTGLNIQI